MSKSNGSGLRWRRERLLALVWLGLFFCFLLVAAWPNSGLELSKPLQSIEQRLIAIVSYCEQQEQELQHSQELAEKLRSELEGLRSELRQWRESSEEYRSQAEMLLILTDELETRLGQLSQKYEVSERLWRQTADTAARREKVWRWLAIVGIPAALAGGVVIGVLAGR